MKDRPNVILILTDDQGYGDLACHGNPDRAAAFRVRLEAGPARVQTWLNAADGAVCGAYYVYARRLRSQGLPSGCPWRNPLKRVTTNHSPQANGV